MLPERPCWLGQPAYRRHSRETRGNLGNEDLENPSSGPQSWAETRGSQPLFLRPLLAIEWATEWLVHWLNRWALIELLQLLANFSILLAVISYTLTYREARDSERKARHFQAWQVLNSAHGKPGNGGRGEALEDLHADGVSLARIDLSRGELAGFQLPGADLTAATLDTANLSDLTLTGSSLYAASLRGAGLTNVHLDSANLESADLSGARLLNVSLRHANLAHAKLEGAVIVSADLRDSDLSGVNLRGVIWVRDSTFDDPRQWRTARWSGTNVAGLGGELERWAICNGAVAIDNDSLWNEFIDPARLAGGGPGWNREDLTAWRAIETRARERHRPDCR
jgi:uncharacterized protein YjbI with pentapeptide repeats